MAISGNPSGSKLWSWVALAALIACAATLLILPADSRAEVTKLYNAAHSLTGDCETSTIDEIPDPGCPEVAHPPQGHFVWPKDVATDPAGDIYVVNADPDPAKEGHFYIDVFNSEEHYVSQVDVPEAAPERIQIAVDSQGYLYVVVAKIIEGQSKNYVLRYEPTTYDPAAGEIAYESPEPPLAIVGPPQSSPNGVEVDPTTRDVYVRMSNSSGAGEEIRRYGPASPEIANELLTKGIAGESTVGANRINGAHRFALDVSGNRIYALDDGGYCQCADGEETPKVKVFELQAPYSYIGEINDSSLPSGSFPAAKFLSIGVDEKTGDVFVGDIESGKKIYEYGEDQEFLGILKRGNGLPVPEGNYVGIAVDNSPSSPNSGFLYVPWGIFTAPGRLLAYEPKAAPQPPKIESITATDVTETEAILRARVNPRGEATRWKLEYVTEEAFEASGFEAAQLAGEGELTESAEGRNVFSAATGLTPGTEYRYRIVAENQCKPAGCATEKEGTVMTFRAYLQTPSAACSNGALRSGASSRLPDCRAYELVTPSDTAGLEPFAAGGGNGPVFPTPPASPSGESLAYAVYGGIIPGTDATGSFFGDTYVANRTAAGWLTEAPGPNGVEDAEPTSGGLSADHRYFAFEALYQGTLIPNGDGIPTTYVHYPDDTMHMAGEGPFGTEREVNVRFISPNGTHIIFDNVPASAQHTAVPLLEGAPAPALYDRTPDQALHILSVLPDGTPVGVGTGGFVAASSDGNVVAFLDGTQNPSPIILRIDDERSVYAAPGGAKLVGLSSDGQFMSYLYEGNLYRFNAETEGTDEVVGTGDVIPVNISEQGNVAYFVSPSVLPSSSNPYGAEPAEGGENLYRWDAGSTEFIGTVTPRDVSGEDPEPSAVGPIDGLGLWLAKRDGPAAVSGRANPNGSVFVFESRADLTGFDAGGKAEIYRYDATAAALECLTCSPVLEPPKTDSRLTTVGRGVGSHKPVVSGSVIPNLSADGERVFFETSERLVTADNDDLQDVYEWEADGKGSCADQRGCLFLISSGASADTNYLMGVSQTGNDVFFTTTDLLVKQDTDETPSVYDARVGGGFSPPTETAAECLGEACQPSAVAPNDPTPNSANFEGEGNVQEGHGLHCRKGQRKVVRHGKARCIRLHKKRHHGHHRKSAPSNGRNH